MTTLQGRKVVGILCALAIQKPCFAFETLLHYHFFEALPFFPAFDVSF
jgi:hypothetical protein